MISASTYKVALPARLYLYKEVVDIKPRWMEQAIAHPLRFNFPGQDEMRRFLEQLNTAHGSRVWLVYGTGMGLNEGPRLRARISISGSGRL